MESLDLHPEELFDKAARGAASADELARIDAHLASCATCRFERQVRSDFDAVSASPTDLDDLVARAMSGALAQPEAPLAATGTSGGPPRRRRFTPLLVAGVVLMGVTSLAAVGQWTGVLPKVIERLTASPDRAPEPTPSPPPRAPKSVSAPVAPEPVAVIEEQKVEEIAVIPSPVPAPVAAVRPNAPSRARSQPNVEPTAPVTPEIPVALPQVVTPPAVEDDALALFTRAQRERVQGDTASAIRDFRMVVAKFPSARESALANAELGRLLLDRGEATSALESFGAYLATSDTVLREDVLGARALALRKLGRFEAERAAWELVLREYPSGVYAPRARSRLEELGH
jgi:TolA-binding protein